MAAQHPPQVCYECFKKFKCKCGKRVKVPTKLYVGAAPPSSSGKQEKQEKQEKREVSDQTSSEQPTLIGTAPNQLFHLADKSNNSMPINANSRITLTSDSLAITMNNKNGNPTVNLETLPTAKLQNMKMSAGAPPATRLSSLLSYSASGNILLTGEPLLNGATLGFAGGNFQGALVSAGLPLTAEGLPGATENPGAVYYRVPVDTVVKKFTVYVAVGPSVVFNPTDMQGGKFTADIWMARQIPAYSDFLLGPPANFASLLESQINITVPWGTVGPIAIGNKKDLNIQLLEGDLVAVQVRLTGVSAAGLITITAGILLA